MPVQLEQEEWKEFRQFRFLHVTPSVKCLSIPSPAHSSSSAQGSQAAEGNISVEILLNPDDGETPGWYANILHNHSETYGELHLSGEGTAKNTWS